MNYYSMCKDNTDGNADFHYPVRSAFHQDKPNVK